MAASPDSDDFTRDGLGAMAVLFEGLRLEGDEAAATFYAYGTFMLDSILFAAIRMIANEQLAEGGAVRTEHTPGMARRSGEQTRRSLDHVMAISVTDPGEDEELFVGAIRGLVEAWVARWLIPRRGEHPGKGSWAGVRGGAGRSGALRPSESRPGDGAFPG